MISVNLVAPIKIINALSGSLDHVVNINSMVGLEAKRNRTLYASGKWGLKGFSDSLKQEEIEYNILDVYPTNIKTWPERENAMEIDYVLKEIYDAMLECKDDLILDIECARTYLENILVLLQGGLFSAPRWPGESPKTLK